MPKAIKELSRCSIDITPLWLDWNQLSPEDYSTYSVESCEVCCQLALVKSGEGEDDSVVHRNIPRTRLGNLTCYGYLDCGSYPAMNYIYPLPGHVPNYCDYICSLIEADKKAARILSWLPLCLVDFRGDPARALGSDIDCEWGLALTGGGMDLSWEICEYYIMLGFLPPTHFCHLPQMSGRGTSTRDKRIISACQASLKMRKRTASNDSRYISLLKSTAEREAHPERVGKK